MYSIRTLAKEAFYRLLTKKQSISYVYKKVLGRSMNWENPTDINEKINWLKVYGDTSLWTICADKYAVRDFVKERGLSDILVPLYGCYKNADEIDFDSLPSRFVIKTNHGSGDCIIVKDKEKINTEEIRKELNKFLSYKYGLYQGEPHYLDIKPCIIIEELLNNDELSFTTSLVDYKLWCFDGKCHSVWACYNRTKSEVYVNIYDLDWICHPEHSVYNSFYRDGKGMVPKPKTLNRMIEAASILSKGFPEVRVDFYEVNGKLFFGEMTFSSHGGYMDFYSSEFLSILGEQCKLPIKQTH